MNLQPGDVVLVTRNGTRRPCLVLEPPTYTPREHLAVKVCLLSNEIPMSARLDMLLDRIVTQWPFDLIAETDLSASVYVGDCQPFVPCDTPLRADLLQYAQRSAIRTDDPPPGLCGTPCHGPSDERYEWKVNELSRLQDLSRECMCEILDW